MALTTEKLLDRTGWRILRHLQDNARISFAELGRHVGLTSPAVAGRVEKLEQAGIINGYRAEIDAARIGLPVSAFIRVSMNAERYPAFIKQVNDLPQVLECHHVTGGESFVLKVAVASITELEALIGQLSPYGQTTTSVILSSPVKSRILKQG
jgi:Lrp/AsnC family transcriptional regulator, leucine-responsive regulatory protein